MLIDYHRTIVGDRVRNEAFYQALTRAIEPGKTIVADIGSGTGIMGFLAAKLGAKKVYMYEQGDIIGVSQTVAADNKIKNIEFLHGSSTAFADVPMVDVIVSETLGNYALEEHIISTLADARRFLKPGGTLIPGRIRQFAAPVVTNGFHHELCLWDDVGYGLDFKAAKEMGFNNIYVRTFAKDDLLEPALCWDDIDLSQDNDSSRQGDVSWTLTSDASVTGLAVWWSCDLIPGISLSTAPGAPKTHWEQLYFPVKDIIQAQTGDTIMADIASASSPEEGTIISWIVTHKNAKGKILSEQSYDLRNGYIG